MEQTKINMLITKYKHQGFIPVDEFYKIYDHNQKDTMEALEYLSSINLPVLEKDVDLDENIKSLDDLNDEDFEYEEIDNQDLDIDYSKNYISSFFYDIKDIKVLSKEEELYWFKKLESIENKDSEEAISIRNFIVEHNLKLVVYIAKEFMGRGLQFNDLVQEGCTNGLMKAISKFDYHKGYKFSTYATPWIKESMRIAIDKQVRSIRLPSNLEKLIKRKKNVETKLTQKLSREPSKEELANELSISVDKLEELEAYEKIANVSRDDDSLENKRSDTLTPQEVMIKECLNKELLESLDILDEKERDIIDLAFGIGTQKLSLKEIGEKYNVTKESIRQMEQRALNKIRNYLAQK